MERWILNQACNEALGTLKDFQLATVKHVYDRLVVENAQAMLVADEVGLGKTLVAKGLIAKNLLGIKRQHNPFKVTYICSNQVIADENMRKLHFFPSEFFMPPPVQRISFLAYDTAANVPKNKVAQSRLVLNTLTPGTSFSVSNSLGRKDERALIYALLNQDKYLSKRSRGLRWILKGNVGKVLQYWRDMKRETSKAFKAGIQRDFIKTIKHDILDKSHWEIYDLLPGWRKRSVYDAVYEFSELVRSRGEENRYHAACSILIKRLRRNLIRTCLHYVDSDLYILDEFQRFRSLIDQDNDSEEAEIARQIFNKPNAKVLLLSATPFKAYTHYHEITQNEEHFADFKKVLGFLLKEDPLKLKEYDFNRSALYEQIMALREGKIETNTQYRVQLETILRDVMVRTERNSVAADVNTMIRDTWKEDRIPFSAGDVRSYNATDQLYQALEEVGYKAGKPTEYVKSALFPFSFLDHYKVRTELEANLDHPSVSKRLSKSKLSWVDYEALNDYSFDPSGSDDESASNARVRLLIDKSIGKRGAELLWVPPSLPYYPLKEAFAESAGFSKTLVFSSWVMVPRMLSTMLSYEVERRTVANPYTISDHTDKERVYFTHRRSPAPLLTWDLKDGQPASMSNFTLVYPSPLLAAGLDLRHNVSEQLTHDDLVQDLVKKYETLFKQYGLDSRATNDPKFKDRWYWAVPLLLDLESSYRDDMMNWLRAEIIWRQQHQIGPDSGELTHYRTLLTFAEHPDSLLLGPVPEDLFIVLAELTLGSPAILTQRSVSKLFDENLEIEKQLDTSSRVANYFRDLFNKPESIAAVRLNTPKVPYWRRVAQYAGYGCLQAVIDEYLHLIKGQLHDPTESVEYFASALSIRTSSIDTDSLNSFTGAEDKRKLRMHYAVEMGSQKIDTEGGRQRVINVRELFNSPFRPFVLSTTSIGQEGLDFHTYCRRIVHWNLPGNPVDLEQREGRINRYKGLVIRQHLAAKYGPQLLPVQLNDDIWERLFALADKEERVKHGKSELVPYWHLDDVPEELRLERVIPLYPFSQDQGRLARILQTLAVYRLAFGQPRQAELVDHLLERDFTSSELEKITKTLMIDLCPLKFKKMESSAK